MADLEGMRVAILATDGFEESELNEPAQALRESGARVEILAPQGDSIQGYRHHDKGGTVSVDRTLGEARAEERQHHLRLGIKLQQRFASLFTADGMNDVDPR